MYVHIFMSKMDIDLRACACQCVKFSLYTCLCMNICKCMVYRIKTLSDGVMLHWNASTNFRLVDEPTQHDEDGANTITCNMRKYSLCNGWNKMKQPVYLPKWYHCWKQLLQSPPCCKRSENQREVRKLYLYLLCCIEGTHNFHERRAISAKRQLWEVLCDWIFGVPCD